MSSFDWERFLKRWSQEAIDAIGRDRDDLPPEVLRSGWLGYPGATEQQITRAETRLGKALPPSYQAFLRVTNGWRKTPLFSNKLWSVEEIEWFAVKHQAWINAFLEKAEQPPAESSNDKAPNPSIPDAEYFIYGDAQDCRKIRVEYLQTALEISQQGDGAIYLLNPQIVTPDGEWEAWFFGDWLPGADRYRSFQDMMQAEYESFLELRETPVGPATPLLRAEPAVSLPTAMAATAALAVNTPESEESGRAQFNARRASAPAMAENWRDLASFTLEFQTRQDEGRLEQRSIVCHRETNAVEMRPDMDTAALHQWMLKQLPGRSTPGEASLGVGITQLRVIRAAQSEPPMVANQTQPTFSDSIQQGEPFTLEVAIQVVEKGDGAAVTPRLEQRLEQPIVFRAQGVARHLATRLDTDLGDITTHFAGEHPSTHAAQFPEVRLEQPGLYRLSVWVTPQNISAAPGYFKVPMLLVV